MPGKGNLSSLTVTARHTTKRARQRERGRQLVQGHSWLRILDKLPVPRSIDVLGSSKQRSELSVPNWDGFEEPLVQCSVPFEDKKAVEINIQDLLKLYVLADRWQVLGVASLGLVQLVLRQHPHNVLSLE